MTEHQYAALINIQNCEGTVKDLKLQTQKIPLFEKRTFSQQDEIDKVASLVFTNIMNRGLQIDIWAE